MTRRDRSIAFQRTYAAMIRRHHGCARGWSIPFEANDTFPRVSLPSARGGAALSREGGAAPAIVKECGE